jgi:Flagellar hook-length control protein FliK
MRLELSTMRAAGSASPTGGLMAQWRVGAIVEAIAVRDASDGQLWLNIGTTRVPARIASGNAAGPSNGERLQLRVLRDHPVLALETIEPTDNESAAVSEALRRFLPRQSSPAPLLANLAWLASHAEDSQQLTRAVTEAVQKLWAALPDAVDLGTPEGLANAVKRSGTFLESTLAQSEPADARQIMGRDLKALLLNLKQTLQRSGANTHAGEQPPGPLPALRGPLAALDAMPASLAAIQLPARQLNELASQADGALARMNAVQLANSEAVSPSTWLIELPLRRDGKPETLRFRFERNSQRESAEQSWTIEASLSLGSSGTVHARISLYGKRIGVQLHAEPPQLVADLSAKVPLLSAMLSESGLEVDRVVCLHGMPTPDREAPATSLLDVRA